MNNVMQPLPVMNVPTAPQIAMQYPVGGSIMNLNQGSQVNATGQAQDSGGFNFLSNTPSNPLSTGTVFNPGTAAAVDQFGNSAFGIGKLAEVPGPSLPGAMGPAPNGVGVEGGLSSNFSGANLAAGAIGGFAANKVFGGGIGTNIGSTIGGIAGSFGGPIGTAIGSFIGGGIGSMFGKKKPSNRLQVGGINMATGQYDAEGSKLFSQKDNKFSEANARVRDAYSMATADMVKYLRESDATPKEEVGNLVIRVGDRSGYDYFFEKTPTSNATQDFRGSQRNAELMNMQDSERNIQSFGKDANAFGEGLQNGVLSKFNATPEQLDQAKKIFAAKVNELSAAQGGGGNLSMPIPMVAPKRTFDEFMQQKKSQEVSKV
jgi:hypothetical protein